MNCTNETLEQAVIECCAAIGANPLLVQGAGGNVSWKDGDTLWVKASGTWLSEAKQKDIFVPVDLRHLNAAIQRADFSVTPQLRGDSALRPSIETLLHALMPHRVVVHVHAIEILAHLVNENCQATFQSRLDASMAWTMVDYFKPGAALAAAVGEALAAQPDVRVVFLRNHGVVIGGDDIAGVGAVLDNLTLALSTPPVTSAGTTMSSETASQQGQYVRLQDNAVQQLALDSALFNRLKSDWALYPDHVVFLGPKAYAFATWQAFEEYLNNHPEHPEPVFIFGHGVYVKPTFNQAKCAQLRCYYDVLVRQSPSVPLRVLTDAQITELLDWDAEKYRQTLNRP